MLEINQLSFGYVKKKPVLDGADAQFGAGIHLLLGPNGAGKTTLLRLAAGLLTPQQGACTLDGHNVALHRPRVIKNIFMLSDEAKMPLDTINQMVRLHARFYPQFSAEFLAEALRAFGMTGDERLADMSLGNRHKANVAYALSLGTRVVLLDEPANGLDITSKKTLCNLLGSAMDADEERCIVIATHTVQEMRNLFDSVTILNRGTVALNVATATLCEKVAFVSGAVRRPDAIAFEPSLDGPSQIVPNTDGRETAVDYILLYNAVVGPQADTLKTILK